MHYQKFAKDSNSTQVLQLLVSSIATDVKVVISPKDMVKVEKLKRQTARGGKKFGGGKPANVGNRPLTLNEQRRINTGDTQPKVESNVIEDCHIQTTDSSYGDWLIQQGIPSSEDINLDPLMTPG